MKSVRIAIIGAAAAALLTVALPAAPAAARDSRDSVSFSFDVGTVRMGYSDGYWDRDHRWHAWRSARERRAYQKHYHDRYYAKRHTRYPNGGWRDNDGDGTPNRYDDHPNNPRRD